MHVLHILKNIQARLPGRFTSHCPSHPVLFLYLPKGEPQTGLSWAPFPLLPNAHLRQNTLLAILPRFPSGRVVTKPQKT